MRGHPVTEREVAHVLRLLAQEDADGCWLLSKERIAEEVRLSIQTIAEVERRAAVAWGKYIRVSGEAWWDVY